MRIIEDPLNRHTIQAVTRLIVERFVLPVDILIRSADVIARYRRDLKSMISPMLHNSEVLYDRRAA